MWHGGNRGEPELLADAYRNSSNVAVKNGIRTIAFPSISTGIYSYPVDKAATIAVKMVKEFCIQYPDDMDIVRFVLFDADTRRAYGHAIYEAEINQG